MASEPAHQAKAHTLRTLAFELETLAERVEQPSRSMVRAEQLVGEGERIAEALRAVFRGRR